MNNPLVFWPISGALLIWGIAYMGLVVFSFFVATPEHWETLVNEGRIKAEYATYISNIPGWVIGLTVLAALTRLGGAFALMAQHELALPIYSASLAVVALLMFRGFVLADVASVIRPSQVALEAAFFALSVFAVWFAFVGTRNGALN